jgi:hypothetical protein
VAITPSRQHAGRDADGTRKVSVRVRRPPSSKDHRQRQLADQVGGSEIVELDAARAILPGHHANDQK